MLFPLVAGVTTIDIALIIALQTIFSSMIADLVEQSEIKTGRRSEGLFFAAVTFTRKATHGLGTLAAGIILSVVSFPQEANPGSVPAETLARLGWLYAPAVFTLYLLMMVAVGFYRIDRKAHQRNLETLASRAAGDSTTP
jgi:Na+/melibiose symporter-like transporter